MQLLPENSEQTNFLLSCCGGEFMTEEYKKEEAA